MSGDADLDEPDQDEAVETERITANTGSDNAKKGDDVQEEKDRCC